MVKWARARFQPNLPLYGEKRVTACKEHIEISKKASEEGMVLLKNEKEVLPLKKGTKVVLFGKGTFDYVKGGGGSGDVYCEYVRNIYDGLKLLEGAVEIYEPVAKYYKDFVDGKYQTGSAPGMMEEAAFPADMLKGAKEYSDTAIITISRFSGEGWDRSAIEWNGEYNPWESETSMPKTAGKIFPDGDFYLTKTEKELIDKVCDNFARVVVVLNIGGIIDTSFIKNDDRIESAIYMGQAGMEGGLALAEILTGEVTPSGHLTDTYAASLDDYPSTANFHESFDYVDYTEDIYVGYRYFETIPGAKEKVVYPFGYGLSYTQFKYEDVSFKEKDGVIMIELKVTNTGKYAGKDVVSVYTGAPQGLLRKPARELKAFAKTDLLSPGESQQVSLAVRISDMASYDDLGKIAKSAYVLEKGAYSFYIGSNVRDAIKADYEYTVSKDTVVLQLTSKCAPTSIKKRLLSDGTYEELPMGELNDKNACIFEKMEPGTEEAIIPAVRQKSRAFMMNPYKGHPLMDVVEGKITMDEFVAQLDIDELIHLVGGQPNKGVGNTFGFGNLEEWGIPTVMTEDGPAGVRLSWECGIPTTAWPTSTLIASTWNTDLAYEIGRAGGEELKENNLQIWLTPAVNIHRSPMCGRNFEYYSEDPVLAGKFGAAAVRGIQSNKVAASVKHFAVNNKETNRKHCDSRLSERALREIYLKVFEIIVKEADPWTIMSSYNVINGHRASENRELLEGILRDEWHFNGMVTSDWWTRGEHYKEILAGNDIKMPTGFTERTQKAYDMGAITRQDLERCVKRILGLMIKLD